MELISKIKSFLQQCIRVWHVLRKPTNYEFQSVAKISALGILVIGLLGFIISAFLSFLK